MLLGLLTYLPYFYTSGQRNKKDIAMCHLPGAIPYMFWPPCDPLKD